jgi:hypothetical protein
VTTTRALTINGEPRTVAVEPGQTLLDVPSVTAACARSWWTASP